MKFSSHGTYMRPSKVMEMAVMALPWFFLETNSRKHRPSTKSTSTADSKSAARDGWPENRDPGWYTVR